MKTEQGPDQGGKLKTKGGGKKSEIIVHSELRRYVWKKKKKLAEKCYQELNKLNCVDMSVCCF